MEENKVNYVPLAMGDGFSNDDIAWYQKHGKLPAEQFFTVAHTMIQQGTDIKQIKIDNDIPFRYEEGKNGELVRAYDASITEEEPAAPIALKKGKEGKPAIIIDNFLEIFRHDPHYENIRFNTVSKRAERFGFDPEENRQRWIKWDDIADASSRHYCESRYGIYNKAKHDDAMHIYWKEKEVNPVLLQLESLKPWDGVERCSQFLQKWLKADDSLYTQTVGKILFDSAVARAYSPGIKYDTAIVLIGEKTGEGKSTLVQLLAMDKDFFGEIKDLSGNAKDVIEDMAGKWILEIGEYLMAGNKRIIDKTKAFISRRDDTYRTPYDKYPNTIPRRCVFIATTNDREFIADSTAERKWLPVVTYSDGSFVEDDTEIKEDIKLCYAEALHRYNEGKAVLYFPRDLQDVAKTEQEAATVDDDRYGVILKWCEEQRDDDEPIFILPREVWIKALEMPKDKTFPRDDCREIKKLMRKIWFLREDEYKTHRNREGVPGKGFYILPKSVENQFPEV